MKSYLITDPSCYSDLSSFQDYLQKAFAKQPHYAAFRDKKNKDILPYAKEFLSIARQKGISKLLLNKEWRLAATLGYDGVHLTSTQFHEIADAKAKGLFTFISTHTIEEGIKAAKEGADAVTISPIFASPGKGEPKGMVYLTRYLETIKPLGVEVFALGGVVSSEQIALLQESVVDGFASIRYFI